MSDQAENQKPNEIQDFSFHSILTSYKDNSWSEFCWWTFPLSSLITLITSDSTSWVESRLSRFELITFSWYLLNLRESEISTNSCLHKKWQLAPDSYRKYQTKIHISNAKIKVKHSSWIIKQEKSSQLVYCSTWESHYKCTAFHLLASNQKLTKYFQKLVHLSVHFQKIKAYVPFLNHF